MQHGMNRELGQGLREYSDLLKKIGVQGYGSIFDELATGFENATSDEECHRLAARGLTYFGGKRGLTARFSLEEGTEHPEVAQIVYALTRLNHELLKRHL